MQSFEIDSSQKIRAGKFTGFGREKITQIFLIALLGLSACSGVILVSVTKWPGDHSSTCEAGLLPAFVLAASICLIGNCVIAGFMFFSHHSYETKPLIASMCFSVAGVILACIGAFWTARTSNCREVHESYYSMGVTFTVVLIISSVALLCWTAVRWLSGLGSEDENLPILVIVRCSCIPLWTKKLFVALIFVGLATNSIVAIVVNWNDSCRDLHLYVLVSGVVFTVLAVVTLCVIYGGDERKDRLILVFLGVLSAFGLGWASVGAVQLAHAAAECSTSHAHLYAVAVSQKVTLFVVCCVLLLGTCCCRTERLLADVSEGERYDARSNRRPIVV